MQTIILDTELDGFYFESTKMWILHAKVRETGEKKSFYPFRDKDAPKAFRDWLASFDNPKIVFHNGLGFDIFVMMKWLWIKFTVGPDTIDGCPVQFFDTYFASMYLNPDRDGHSLEAWGERLGFPKTDWRAEAISLGLIEKNAPKGAEFQQWHERMGAYCEQDVNVCERTLYQLEETMMEYYGELSPEHFRRSQKNFFLMACQGYTGVPFDEETAIALKERIAKDLDELKQRVDAHLPPRALKKGEMKEYTMPAKPFKKDGSFSSHMLNFITKHGAKDLGDDTIEIFGQVETIEAGKLLDVKVPMTIADQDAIKDWLIDEGWSPTLWNFKKGPDGKPERGPGGEYVKTSPKMQESGKLCPDLEEMDNPVVKDVVRYLSARNRHSVLEGWLSHPRLRMDGRLPAVSTGLASSHRQKHAVVVNVPKAQDDVLYGKEFRSLFRAGEGKVLAAADAAALEARVEGDYTYKYDGGAYCEILLAGDVHSVNMKAFYPVETRQVDINSTAYDKDGPTKKYRGKAKNGKYA